MMTKTKRKVEDEKRNGKEGIGRGHEEGRGGGRERKKKEKTWNGGKMEESNEKDRRRGRLRLTRKEKEEKEDASHTLYREHLGVNFQYSSDTVSITWQISLPRSSSDQLLSGKVLIHESYSACTQQHL